MAEVDFNAVIQRVIFQNGRTIVAAVTHNQEGTPFCVKGFMYRLRGRRVQAFSAPSWAGTSASAVLLTSATPVSNSSQEENTRHDDHGAAHRISIAYRFWVQTVLRNAWEQWGEACHHTTKGILLQATASLFHTLAGYTRGWDALLSWNDAHGSSVPSPDVLQLTENPCCTSPLDSQVLLSVAVPPFSPATLSPPSTADTSIHLSELHATAISAVSASALLKHTWDTLSLRHVWDSWSANQQSHNAHQVLRHWQHWVSQGHALAFALQACQHCRLQHCWNSLLWYHEEQVRQHLGISCAADLAKQLAQRKTLKRWAAVKDALLKDAIGKDGITILHAHVQDSQFRTSIDLEFMSCFEWIRGCQCVPATPEQQVEIYALHQQATRGDAQPTACPAFFNVVARLKWAAWLSKRGTHQDEAKSQYVKLVHHVHSISQSDSKISRQDFTHKREFTVAE